MSTVFRTAEFDQLVAEGRIEAVLEDFSLDYSDLLEPFNPIRLFFGGVDLWIDEVTASRIDLFAEPLFRFGETPEGFYTMTIEGAGFGPLGDAEDFEDALDMGEATGRIDRILIDFEPFEEIAGPFTILDMTLTPDAYTLISGNQTLEITGALPNSFEQFGDFQRGFFEFVDSISGEDDEEVTPDFAILTELFQEYRFDSLSLLDRGEEVLGVRILAEGLEITIDDYRILFCDFELDLERLFEAFGSFDDLDDALIWPEIAIYNEQGELMPQSSEAGFIFASGFQDTTTLSFSVSEEGTGTYFIQVAADPNGPLSTGLYQLIESFNFFFDDDLSEDDYERVLEVSDAPADITTPYTLPIGDPMVSEPVGDFLGRIDPEGDTDWIRVDISEPGNYTFRAIGLPDNPDDLNLDALFDLFGATCVRVFNPGGDLIAEAENPADLFGDPAGPGGPGDDDDDDDDDGPGDIRWPDLPPGPAWGLGDPHLFTLDGVGYDFHAAGEYVMTRATDGSAFQVQARMAPVGENVTANIAAAVQLDGAAVMVDARGQNPLTVNGVATSLEDGGVLDVGGDSIYRQGDSYLLVHTRDGLMESGYSAVRVDIIGDRVDIIVGLDNAWRGNVEGLLGNFDGNPGNDIALPDGTVLDRPLRFEDVYGNYREAWRVSTEEQSLFAYADGEGPDSFYLPDYPTAMITLDDFAQDLRDAAAAQLEDAGLEPGTLAFNNALLDLLLTGDESYIGSAQTAQEKVDTRPEESAAPSVPEVAGGGLEGLVTLSGRLVDVGGDGLSGATVTFQATGRSVNLTRHTRDGDEFGFDMLPSGGGGRLEAMRAYDQSEDGRPSALDALDVLRLAVGLAPSFGDATPEAFIAADINRDGQVTALDALEVLRSAVGLVSENAPQWVFVDANADLSQTVAGRHAVSYDTGVQIDGFDADMGGFDMKGILLGDMSAFA